MDCLAIETPSSSYEHISSLLEDFQDKNSHLFPSTDLSFDMCSSFDTQKITMPSCGSKRTRETSYDSFSSWNKLLSDSLNVSTIVDDINSSTVGVDTSCITKVVKQELNNEHPEKKRKLSEDEELSIFMSDARSRSPPFHSLDIDSDSIPSEICTALPPPALSSPSQISVSNNILPSSVNTPIPPVLSQVLGTISTLDEDVKKSIFNSLNRLATRAASGKNPIQFPRAASRSEQIDASHDYLTMQTLFGVPPPTIIKPERSNSYIPVPTAGVPFVMNIPYASPNTITPQCIDSSYKNINTPMYSTQPPCTKTMIYPEVTTNTSSTGILNQQFLSQNNMYNNQNIVHV